MKTEQIIIFPDTLRQAMDQNKVSVRELSMRTGVPAKTIYHWLSGQIPRKIDHALRVSQYFNLSLEYLFFGIANFDHPLSMEKYLPSRNGDPVEVLVQGDSIILKVCVSLREVRILWPN